MCPDGKQGPEALWPWPLTVGLDHWTLFREKFTETALSIFGSGYLWLVNGKRGLCLMITANQDTPTGDVKPLLNLDVWEHAYYLKHYNKRVDYIHDWWNVVNWDLAGAEVQMWLHLVENPINIVLYTFFLRAY